MANPEAIETKIVEIVVNGQPRQVPGGISLDRLLAFLEVDATRVAIERNREIAHQSAWSATFIQAGDQLEIVWFVGGG